MRRIENYTCRTSSNLVWPSQLSRGCGCLAHTMFAHGDSHTDAMSFVRVFISMAQLELNTALQCLLVLYESVAQFLLISMDCRRKHKLLHPVRFSQKTIENTFPLFFALSLSSSSWLLVQFSVIFSACKSHGFLVLISHVSSILLNQSTYVESKLWKCVCACKWT